MGPRWPGSGRRLCRPYTQGRKAGRPAGPTNRESGVDHQHEHCQGARPHLSDHAARSRRRGDRIVDWACRFTEPLASKGCAPWELHFRSPMRRTLGVRRGSSAAHSWCWRRVRSTSGRYRPARANHGGREEQRANPFRPSLLSSSIPSDLALMWFLVPASEDPQAF